MASINGLRVKSIVWFGLVVLLALCWAGCSPRQEIPMGTPSVLPPTPTLGQGESEQVSFRTGDGMTLQGTLYMGEDGNDFGVVLAHMGARGADQTSWADFARLASRRGFTVLTFNFRNNRSKLDQDVLAAVSFLRDQGCLQVACLGASMGGTACLKAALEEDLAGVGVISSLWTTGSGAVGGPLVVSRDELAQLTLPKLFVTTEQDGNGVPAAMEEMYQTAQEPKGFQTYPGTVHGTDIFLTSAGEAFRDQLLAFLEGLR